MKTGEQIVVIPSIGTRTETNKRYVVFVVDSSGSMKTIWPFIVKNINQLAKQMSDYVIITFSDNAKRCESLDSDIRKHEGGGTNITKGITLMVDTINSIYKEELSQGYEVSFTVLFISDGEGAYNYNTNMKIIAQNTEFLVLGIGSKFPTRLSMDLRTTFGDKNKSPNVFLVLEYNNEEVQKVIEMAKEFFDEKKQYNISPDVSLLPGAPEVTRVYEGDIHLLPPEIKYMELNSYKLNFTNVPITYEILKNLFESWVQELDAMVLAKKPVADIQKCVDETLKKMKSLKDSFLEDELVEYKPTALSRVKKLMRKDGLELAALIKLVKDLIENRCSLSHLSDEQLAARLAIKTFDGKYIEKAILLHGIPTEYFDEAKANFIENLPRMIEAANNTSGQQCAFSLQTNAEILLEKFISEAINSCGSPHILVQSLAIVGYSLFIIRCDGTQMNPWLVYLKNGFYGVISEISSLSLLDERCKEDANCVLPLIPSSEGLNPYYKTAIFNILITYNVTGNADTIFKDAYLALMAAAYVFLIPNKDTRAMTIKKSILHTTKLVYSDTKSFKDYIEVLTDKPQMAMIADHPSIETTCPSLNKPIISLAYLMNGSEMPKFKDAVKYMALEQLGRTFNGMKIEEFFEAEHLGDKISLDELGVDPTKYYTIHEMKKNIWNKVCTHRVEKSKFGEISFKSKLIGDTLDLILKFYESVTGEQLCINMEELLYHVCKKSKKNYETDGNSKTAKTSYERMCCPIVPWDTVKDNIFKQIYSNAIMKYKQEQVECLTKLAITIYMDNYKRKHTRKIPMSEKDILDRLGDEKFQKIKYNTNNGLCNNACMSLECEYFLQPNDHFNTHSSTWNLCGVYPVIPAFHRTVKTCCHKSADEIYKDIKSGKYAKTSLEVSTISSLELHKNEILKDIEEVRLAYLKIR